MEKLNEFVEQARALDHHYGRVEQKPGWRENILFICAVLSSLAGAVFFAVTFYFSTTSKLSGHDDTFKAHDNRIVALENRAAALEAYKASNDATLKDYKVSNDKALDSYIYSNNLAIAAMKDLLEVMRDTNLENKLELKRISPMVDRMEWQREQTEKNKKD